MSHLVVPISVLRFSAVNAKLPNEDKFAGALATAAETTKFREVRSSRDLLLLSSGKTPAGFRYSVTAMRQLCTLLCRGLGLAVLDLSGFLGDRESSRSVKLDEQFAVEAFNKVLHLRGQEALKSRRLVVDSRTGIVHGVVGSRYQPFSNHELYRKSKSFFVENAVFHEASLHGLSMVLRFRSPEPFFVSPEGETFYSGWSLRNSETGTKAVQGAPVLFRRRFDRKVVDQYGSSKLPHVRSEFFVSRFEELLVELRRRAPDVEILQQRLEELSSTSLGLGVDRTQHEQRLRWLSRRLFGRTGLTYSLAKKAVQRVLTHTADGPEEVRIGQDRYLGWESRTHFDLLDCVLAASGGRLPEEQEAVLHFGYRVLQSEQKVI